MARDTTKQVTADIFYAQRHGERFHEEALQHWGEEGAFRHTVGMEFPRSMANPCNDEQTALNLAEVLFEHTNTVSQWWTAPNVFRNYTDQTADTCRSMCVGDVIQFIFTDTDNEVTVGCASVGFVVLSNKRGV